MNCEFYTETECKLSSQIAGVTCPSDKKACERCIASDNPRGKNVVTVGVAVAYALKNKKAVEFSLLKELGVAEPQGPGTELKNMLSWFYLPDDSKCKCNDRIAKMNGWGADGCEQRIETILRWLRHSAAENKIPFSETAVRMLVNRAISNARKQSV